MRKLILATIIGATLSISTQAATPRAENKNNYEQGRKNPEYNKHERDNRGQWNYEHKKADGKRDRWERNARQERRGDNRFHGKHNGYTCGQVQGWKETHKKCNTHR